MASPGEGSYRTPDATPTCSPDPEDMKSALPQGGVKTELPPAPASVPAPVLAPAPVPVPAPAAAPGGNIETAKPAKRGRRSTPKVKTGCLNCKQRRIKCDEKRPFCSQCIRSKKECAGYPAPRRTARSAASDVRIAPKPLAPLAPLIPPSAGTSRLQPAAPTSGGMASLLLAGHSIMLPPRRVNRRRRQADDAAAVAPMPTPMSMPYEPSHSLALMHTESLYFDLFRVQTASELSGYFNMDFWTQRLLQECHFEPSIRHAVVALGALYKTLEQSCEPDSATLPGAMSRMESVMCHWQVAVRKYSEACNAMLLLSGDRISTNKTRLMASVLLACFDSFIGDHRQAIVQIQTGLRLLARIQRDRARNPHPSERVEEDLLVIFTRFAIQAKSYDMAFHFPHPYVIQLGPQSLNDPSSPLSDSGSPQPSSPIPHEFASLREARLASDRLCEMLLRFIEHLQVATREPSYHLPPSWLQLGLTFQAQIDSWTRAFEPIFQSRLQPGIDLLEKSAISALKMFHMNTQIVFLTIFCKTEVQFDSFLPHFKQVVSLGWEVVGDDEKRAAPDRCPDPQRCRQHHDHGTSSRTHNIKPSFSADLGIVTPLFVVATKCRDPIVRRESIRLLRSSSRREGMWDSELAANIGQWIMELEEADAFPDLHHHPHHNHDNHHDDLKTQPGKPTTPTIPEEKRVMVQSVDFDLRARFADLTVGSRDARQGMRDQRHRTTRITW